MSTTIPSGSTVLVTGLNGYIASHIADQILGAGFKVRGTARTVAKADQIKQALEKKHGSGKLEVVAVPDMAQANAFDEAVKGCSGVVHVASNLSFENDPNKVIPEVIAGVKSILESAAKESSIKRFVFTSSSTAATGPNPNTRVTVTKDTWNTEDIKKAWGPDFEGREYAIYGASKTEAERALWKFMEEKTPSFVANAVLPNANLGPTVGKGIKGSSTWGWVAGIYNGSTEHMKGIPAQWAVDVRDTARLHLAGLVLEDVKSERIFAFSAAYNTADIVSTIKQIKPEWIAPEDSSDAKQKDLMTIEPRERAEEILKRLGRKDGFIGFQEMVAANIEEA